MKRIVSRGVWITALVSAALLLAIVIIGKSRSSFLGDGERAVVAMIDGEPVTVAEFRLIMTARRAEIYRYFQQSYNAGDSSQFWTSSYGGEVPLQKLKMAAINESATIKVQQLWAKQEGVVQEIGYPAFLRRWEEENASRAKAASRNLIVYGPTRYEKLPYYDIVFGNLAAELKKKLVPSIAPSDRELHDYYERHKEELYKKEDAIHVQVVSVPFPYGDAAGTENLRTAMNGLRIRWLESGAVEPPLQANGPESSEISKNWTVGRRTIDDSTLANDTKYSPLVTEAARKLSGSEVSAVIEESGVFTLLGGVEKTVQGYIPFDEAKTNMKALLLDRRYEEEVMKRVRQAQIRINEPVYNRIDM
ncbi:peptidyl-prolyl cis-trans isomerase [Paenibacillus hemerocallicola]|uniref:Peptidyl-prolyl cis-trans isomerase n=1 Tax=Paenibacillus hemerocallicola TaxID=1172614 RepID=A0A5C4T3K5_9BACL|nr:peptidylprolyl isomerase [Paenibacillus hemerocallicola]TNJ63355.1 peptidyl-prolyl cis-trans isomerase [Paenibacillus hemerocallicola]